MWLCLLQGCTQPIHRVLHWGKENEELKHCSVQAVVGQSQYYLRRKVEVFQRILSPGMLGFCHKFYSLFCYYFHCGKEQA